MQFTSLEFDIIVPAMLAGLLVLSTHVPLGREVLRRGIIFIDLAIAQIAGLGVIAAYNMGWEVGGWQVQLVAASSAVAGAILLRWLEHHWHDSLEALIGCGFVCRATCLVVQSARKRRIIIVLYCVRPVSHRLGTTGWRLSGIFQSDCSSVGNA